MRDRAAPKVSVIIPCYNRGPFLDDGVTSCLEAYSGPLEIIVVDDGSTASDTGRWLDALRALPVQELKIIRQANAGPARARNVGLSHCTGDYVQFLDSDDILFRNKIAHQLRQLEIDPELDVSVSDYLTCDRDRLRFTAPPPTICLPAATLDDFLYRWERGLTIPIHTALFRRRVLADPPCWPEVVRGKEDWLFWVRLMMRGTRLGYLPLRLCAYRLHADNMTREWNAMGLDFINAASQIESWLNGRHPEFMAGSMRWYAEFYATRAATETRPHASAGTDAAAPAGSDDARVGLAPPDPAIVDDATRDAAASISVAIPIFNHARYLCQCILSAHHQTVAPREIVCVDDASTDPEVRATLEGLRAEVPELRLRFLESNRGIAEAQNIAVGMATGEFVAFLDCDDFLAPMAIGTVAARMVSHPDVDYFFTDRYEVDAEGRRLRHAVYGGYPVPHHRDRVSHHENLLDEMVASHLKVIRRSSILAAGGFDARASGAQDWDLALRVAECGRLHYIDVPAYHHRIHRASVTLGQRVLMFRRTNEIRRHHQAIRAGVDPGRTPAWTTLASVAALYAGPAGGSPRRDDLRWERALDAWRHEPTGALIVQRPGPPRDAFRRWAASPATIFALPTGAPVETLAFLREFNSYFDLVVCADEAQWAALHHYTWDPRALRLADELPEPEARRKSRGAVSVP